MARTPPEIRPHARLPKTFPRGAGLITPVLVLLVAVLRGLARART